MNAPAPDTCSAVAVAVFVVFVFLLWIIVRRLDRAEMRRDEIPAMDTEAMRVWAESVGHTHILECLRHGYEPHGVYLRERLTHEVPGAKVCRHATHWFEEKEPTLDALYAKETLGERLVGLGLPSVVAVRRPPKDVGDDYFWGVGEEALVFEYAPGAETRKHIAVVGPGEVLASYHGDDVTS